jgi:hypothetical protein
MSDGSVKRASARELRRVKLFDVEVTGFGTVAVKKADIVGLIMSGAIPMHLLSAMAELAGSRVKTLEANPMSILEMPQEEAAAVFELLQRYACQVEVDPRIVMHDDVNQDHLPVDILDTNQLLEIWRAVPPESSMLDQPTAKEFPDQPTAVPPDAPHDGGEVRPEAVVVAAPDREVITQ